MTKPLLSILAAFRKHTPGVQIYII